jgi:general secretion pathway protein N
LFIGFISYLIFLALTAPLEYVWPKVQPHLGPLPVSIDQVQGTVWQGQGRVNIPNVGKVTGQWDIQLAALLSGQLSAAVNIKGDELKFKGLVTGSLGQLQIDQGEAFLSSRYLQPVLRQGRSSLTGDFELSQFSGIFLLKDQQILAAAGRLLFTGGDVSFPLDGKNVNATLPVLVGAIQKPAENVELVITNTDGQDIGNGYIQPDGWAGIGIRRRFLDILGLQWPANVAAEKIIFEASQKLL